jgi:hypothetical protein
MNLQNKGLFEDHNKDFTNICNLVMPSQLLKHTTAYGNFLTLCRSELKLQEKNMSFSIKILVYCLLPRYVHLALLWTINGKKYWSMNVFF